MKRLIRDSEVEATTASEENRKLKRTPESEHSYDYHVVFDDTDEMMKWWKEDKLYDGSRSYRYA